MRLRKIKGLRWWMIGLIMLGAIINYLTRSTLAVAAPTMLKDLQITTQQYSWILGAFQGAIMLQPLCGYVLDVLDSSAASPSSRSPGRSSAWRTDWRTAGRRSPGSVVSWDSRKARRIRRG